MKYFTVKGKVFKYPGAGGWHFIAIDKKIVDKIKKERITKVGFGFVKVEACVKKNVWLTSLFPAKEGHYLLSIKANIRKREGIFEGDIIKVELKLI